jgi:hypothetical protein
MSVLSRRSAPARMSSLAAGTAKNLADRPAYHPVRPPQVSSFACYSATQAQEPQWPRQVRDRDKQMTCTCVCIFMCVCASLSLSVYASLQVPLLPHTHRARSAHWPPHRRATPILLGRPSTAAVAAAATHAPRPSSAPCHSPSLSPTHAPIHPHTSTADTETAEERSATQGKDEDGGPPHDSVL